MKNLISKYGSKKVIYNGIKFDSKKEAKYYIKLKILEKAKEISKLELQKSFELQPKFKINNKVVRSITYIADFTYYDKNNKYHVVDVKGYKTDVYKLKKKMFEYKYNIEIEEM